MKNKNPVFHKTYKFKLILKKSQLEAIVSWFGTIRFLYNLAKEQRDLHWRQWKNSLSYEDQANELKNLKKCEGFEWIKDTPAQVIQQSLIDLERAYKSFWKSGFGYPKWKKKSSNQSVRFPDPKQFSVRKVSKRKAFVKLPKIGEVGFRLSRDIEGKIKNCTIKKEVDGFYICFCTEMETNNSNSNSNSNSKNVSIGIDRGIAESFVSSNGEVFELPKVCYEHRDRIKVLQRRLRKQKKFSNNWKKSQQKIRKLHKKITQSRLDFLHKTSSELAKNHSYIQLEDLKIKNMSRSAKGTLEDPGRNVKAKSGLNREILFQGWGIFESQLKYKLEWSGGYLELVDPKFTSQTCSACGFKDKENRKKKVFECKSCGHKEDADLNAAKNINRAGRAQSACGDVNISSICEARTSEKVAI